MSYDPVAPQARREAIGSRVRGAIDMLGRFGQAAADGYRQFDSAYRDWEAEQAARQEDDAAVMAGIPESPPRIIPNVTRPPQWKPTQGDSPNPDDMARRAEGDLRDEIFESELRPGGKEYREADLAIPGAPKAASQRPLPTAQDIRAASPEARKAEADVRSAERSAAQDAARVRPQRQAAASAGSARGARQQEARSVGINTDPAKVEADRQVAVADIRKPKPKSAVQDMRERKDRAAVAADTRQYQQQVAEYDAKRRELETRREAALENGRVEEADALSAQIDALPIPQPTERMRGGQTAAEIMEPVAATLQRLAPEQRNALRSSLVNRFLPNGRAVTAADRQRAERMADEALVSMYDDLEPDERLDVMANDADRVSRDNPLTYGGGDQSTRGGYGYGIGDNALNEDMSPEDLERAGKDTDYGFPMVNEPGRRGGTFVQNADGTWSRRAPNPTTAQLIPGEDQLPINPLAGQMTPAWREQMKIAGMTLGLNPAGFDNEGQFIAAAQKLLARHREMSEKYDTVALPTGGFRRMPNAKLREAMRRRELSRRVEAFVNAHPSADAAALYAAADSGDEKELLRLQTEVRRQKKADQAMAYRDYQQRQTRTRVMNNPNVALGMFVEDLNQAGGDPTKIATVYRQWGMPGEAARVTALDNQRRAAEFENEQGMAKIDAMRGKGDKEDPKPDAEYLLGAQRVVDAAFGANGQDVVAPDQAARARSLHEQRFGEKGATDEQGAYLNARDAVGRGAPISHPVVAYALSQVMARGFSPLRATTDEERVGPVTIDSKRTTFINEARRLFVGASYTDEELGRWFDTNYQK